jgi:O-antigen/teichoic acid export membrane protein
VTLTGRRGGAASPAAAGPNHRDILATAKGGGYLASGSLFEFASRFVIALLLARALGAADYGLYVLAISAATLFSGISLLGLDDAMVRYVAILSARRDTAGLRGTIQIGLGVSAPVAAALGAVLYVAAEPIAVGLFDEPRLTPLLHLTAVIVPFLTISNVLAGVARGFQRMDYAALAENVVQSTVRMALLAAAVVLGGLDTLVATVIFGLSDVAATITLLVLLNRRFPLLAAPAEETRRDVGEVFRFAIPLWFSGLLRQFRRNLEVLILGSMSAASSVGVFAVVNKVSLVGHVGLLSLFLAVKPSLAQLHDKGDRRGLGQLYTTTTRWALGLALPFFLVMVLYREPLLSVFGGSFAAGGSALVVLAFAELANAGTGICGPLIDMTGHMRVKVANAVLWTVLLIAASALLVPRWGVLGAASATLIAVATVNALTVVEVWVLERLLPFDRSLWKPVAAGLGGLATGVVLGRWMPVGADLVPAIVQGTVVVGAYCGLILLFGLAPEDRLVLDRTREKLTRTALARRRRGPRSAAQPTARDSVTPAGAALPPESRGPVYIGGLDRSGKTTLAAFLTSHTAFAIPAAGSNMWTYFYGRFGDLGRSQNLDRCLEAMLRYTHVAVLEPDPERIRREFAAGPPTYAHLFQLFHAHHAEREGKPRWGTQTGLVERYAGHLFAAYPGVRVVHMVRDPRDRYEASIAMWPDGKGRAGGATARWTYSTRLAERNLRRYPDGYLVVRYEDLVMRTEETLREVCTFLGEPFEADMLDMPAEPERRARLLDRAGAGPGDSLLSSAFIGRARHRIPASELAFVQLHGGRLMQAYGYEPVVLGWSAPERARFWVRDWPDQAARMLAWRARETVQQRFPTRVRRTPDHRLIVEPPVGCAR